MANVFLNYIDQRLLETYKALKLGWLGFLQVRNDSLEIKSFVGDPPTQSSYDLSHGLSASVLKDNSTHHQSGGKNSPAQAACPVRYDNKLFGVLYAHAKAPNYFKDHPEVLEELNAVSSQLASLWAQPVGEYAILLDEKIAKLKQSDNAFDWCGVYKLVKDKLYLTSFRGAPSPHEVIAQGTGICGAAITENQILNIPDVKSDNRYLACDLRTKSEIVVPIRDSNGKPIGEIDIDSHQPQAFTEKHQQALEQVANELAPLVLHLI